MLSGENRGTAGVTTAEAGRDAEKVMLSDDLWGAGMTIGAEVKGLDVVALLE
jgi:hypothetical protein